MKKPKKPTEEVRLLAITKEQYEAFINIERQIDLARQTIVEGQAKVLGMAEVIQAQYKCAGRPLGVREKPKHVLAVLAPKP